MVDSCRKCGEPIRLFRGYIREVGEICYTCYLEHLMAQREPERAVVKTTP